MSESFISLIKSNQDIPRDSLILHYISKDGNCWYRALSKFLTNDENNYKEIRQIIYELTKNNKSSFINFFISPKKGLDYIIANKKFDNYIE